MSVTLTLDEAENSEPTGSRSSRRRRHRPSGGPRRLSVDQVRVLPIAAVAGVIAGLSAPAPTGQAWLDVLYVVASVAFVTWAAASAPWWLLMIVSALAIGIGATAVLTAIGAVGFLLAVWIGTRRDDLSLHRAICAGVALNVMVRGQLDIFFGASAVLAIIGAAALVIGGGIRRRTRDRAIIASVVLVATGVLAAASVVFAAAAFAARADLVTGASEAQRGIRLLTELQEVELASRAMDRSTNSFRAGERWINSLWTEPARLVPIVAQQRTALLGLSGGAATISASVRDELESLDLNRLRPADGRFDLAGFDAAGDGLGRFSATMTSALSQVEAVESPWVVPTIERQLEFFQDRVTRELERTESVRDALDIVSPILGGDGQRRYLVLFTTPAEARGHGGFMGNWAEMTVNEGRIAMTEFGRTRDLNAVARNAAVVTGPEDWLDRYGRFGFQNGPGGATGVDPWSNITVSPHFPSTAQVAAEMYPQSGGRDVDGVIALDVDTLAALMGFTGPVQVEVDIAGTDTEPARTEIIIVAPQDARQFLLYDQYLLIDDIDREDLLADLAEEVFTRLADGALGSPIELVRVLGPLVEQGRMTVWMRDDVEQEALVDLGVSGALVDPGADDAIAVAFNNGSGSKLELFLDAAVDYALSIDANGGAAGDVTIELTNDAPTTGWPEGVIGNYFGLPTGTSRLLVTVFSTLPPVSSTLDGVDTPADVSVEAGYFTTSWFVIIDPDQTRTLTLRVEGQVDPDIDAVIVRTPPTVRPTPLTLSVEQADGSTIQTTGDTPGTRTVAIR